MAAKCSEGNENLGVDAEDFSDTESTSLSQQIKALKLEIERMSETLQDQLCAHESQLKKLKGELIAQEHRFVPTWRNFFWYLVRNNEREYAWDALMAILQRFLPGATATILIGGSLAGVLTLVLMYQSNQLTALQNRYLQEQILIQAESDRRDQLINIMEKIYEPTAESSNAQRAFDRLPKEMQVGQERPELEPKFNTYTRTESVLSYINIQQKPLKAALPAHLSPLPQVSRDFWRSLWSTSAPLSLPAEGDVGLCAGLDDAAMESVVLQVALLSEVVLRSRCLRLSDFRMANLEKASFWFSNLQKAKFWSANLRGALLMETDLREANFVGTDLSGAHMLQADLRGADLMGAKLFDADLKGADFRGALNLTCDQLTSAKNWRLAKTELNCEQ